MFGVCGVIVVVELRLLRLLLFIILFQACVVEFCHC